MVELPMIRASEIVDGPIFLQTEERSDFILFDVVMLLNDDLSGHPMVNGTEVRVSSCGREAGGEALSRRQYRRLLELIVVTRHRVGHVVVVSPGYRGPHGYGHSLR